MNYRIYNEDCIEGMKRIDNESVDVILTDPPYLYLKNQKLDRSFDERQFFCEAKRVLKKDGFIILFGRGTSFYRWNTLLDDFGFTFKEEIIWNKGYCTSPLMNLSRIHETVSISTKGKGTIKKSKVPYLEMKEHDLSGIITDIKRLSGILRNPKSLVAVKDFLKNNCRDTSDSWHANNISISSDISKENRCVSVMRSIKNGCNEKKIIRTDRQDCDKFTKYGINADKRKSGDRCCNVMQSMEFGLNEKSVIKETPDHYKAIHPTQKPVRLLVRLINLVKDDDNITILDPFMGSGSTIIASYELGLKSIGFEIDPEYFEAAKQRIEQASQQGRLFAEGYTHRELLARNYKLKLKKI